jgi:hypothetical protein
MLIIIYKINNVIEYCKPTGNSVFLLLSKSIV